MPFPRRCTSSKSSPADGRESNGGGAKKPNEPKAGEDKLELAIKYKRRYQNVFSEGVDTSVEITKTPAMEKDLATTDFLKAALRQNFVFASLEEAEVNKIVEFMSKANVAKGTDLIKQGEQGDYFYIVEEGKFDFIVKGKTVGACGEKRSSDGVIPSPFNVAVLARRRARGKHGTTRVRPER